MNILTNLYVQFGAAYLLAIPAPFDKSYGLSPYDRLHNYNPYGIIAVGFESNTSRKWSFGVQFRHESSIPKNDWGDNAVEADIKWRPFK